MRTPCQRGMQIRQESRLRERRADIAMAARSFNSFDDYALSLGHRDLRMVALGRSRGPWTHTAADVGGVQVRMARDGGPCLVNAAISQPGVGFLVGVEAAGKVTGNGAIFGARSVMVIPGQVEIESTSLDAVSWFSTFIPASRLYAHDHDRGEQQQIHAGVIHLTAPEGIALHDTLSRVVSAAIGGAFDANPDGQRDASDQLVRAARAFLHMPAPAVARRGRLGRDRIPRTEVVRGVHEFIDSRWPQRIGLEELAAAGRVSIRTLHNVFHEQLGVSPRRFLRLRLLNAVRRELRRADPDETRVGDVLARFGVWEWGRFSRDYRALFGELPSQTQRRP